MTTLVYQRKTDTYEIPLTTRVKESMKSFLKISEKLLQQAVQIGAIIAFVWFIFWQWEFTVLAVALVFFMEAWQEGHPQRAYRRLVDWIKYKI